MKVAILIEYPIGITTKQVLGLVEGVEFVDNPVDAEIVVADDARKLVEYYCEQKEFIIFPSQYRNQEAKNVHEFRVDQVAEILSFFATIAQKQVSYVLTNHDEVILNRHIANNGAMKILVIDDTLKHQKSALLQLTDYDLTVANGYDEAVKLLREESFDAVLTDMEMPISMNKTLSTCVLGKLVPYGLLIEKEAVLCNVKHVAIVTDLSHHLDPFACAFDHLSQHSFIVGNSTVKYMHAPMIDCEGEYVKDWATALSNLLS